MRYAVFLFLSIVLFGCMPGPPGPAGPLPPALGGPMIMGLGWIILGIIALFSVFVILKNNYDKKPKDSENIMKILNDINDRLKKLEEDVEYLKKDDKK